MKHIKTLEIRGISKSFGEVTANRNINLSIKSGEIVGLLGENGAGKTTLMNILYGLYQPDEGEIYINDTRVEIRSPRDSIAFGIGMVHQHFMLVQNHTVAENVALAYADRSAIHPARRVAETLEEFRTTYKLDVDPSKYVWQLSAGEQQRIEIAKLLINNADLLIMDEPTSVLTPGEATELTETLARMKDEGHSVIFISHKLEEVLAICDRIVVLRKGEVVGATDVKGVGRGDLAKMMVGREVLFSFDRPDLNPGKTILSVDSVSVKNDRGLLGVNNVSITVREREIFGIAGVSGNGQKELIEAITGLRRTESGSIQVEGKTVSNRSARTANNVGVTHVPEERMRFGIVPNLLLYDNAILKRHHKAPFSKPLFMDYPVIRAHATELVDEFRVDTPSIYAKAGDLSGGNIQKLILGREISGDHSLLVAAHPTYGLDVGATEFIRSHLLSRREAGSAILLVSEDLEEIFALSDRVAVMFAGSIVGIVESRDIESGTIDMEQIGLMMAGTTVGIDSGSEGTI